MAGNYSKPIPLAVNKDLETKNSTRDFSANKNRTQGIFLSSAKVLSFTNYTDLKLRYSCWVNLCLGRIQA